MMISASLAVIDKLLLARMVSIADAGVKGTDGGREQGDLAAHPGGLGVARHGEVGAVVADDHGRTGAGEFEFAGGERGASEDKAGQG